MGYLLDANVFISAKRDHYGFDFCPAFWSWIEHANARGSVYSIEAVYAELEALDDDLTDWAKAHRSMFLPVGPSDLSAIGDVNRWATSSTDYEAVAKVEFSRVADSFLIAQALAGGHKVVTHEQFSNGRRKIKIPNAAVALGVTVVRPFEMLRAERARFVLGAV